MTSSTSKARRRKERMFATIQVCALIAGFFAIAYTCGYTASAVHFIRDSKAFVSGDFVIVEATFFGKVHQIIKFVSGV